MRNDNLIELLGYYRNGMPDNNIPKHGFDFTDDSIDCLIEAVEIASALAKSDYPHNFQLERFDLRDFCYSMSRLQTKAKEWEEQYQ